MDGARLHSDQGEPSEMPVRRRRVVCGWCPLPLPDDMAEWEHHFLVQHAIDGHSVRFYENDDDPLEAWIDGSVRAK